jgi:AmmeMemoRadiSam system protein B
MEAYDESYSVRARFPVVSGLFYPEDALKIKATFRAFGLESGSGGKASAIIAPHGAWELSGAVAAEAFSAAAGRNSAVDRIERVVILGPVHNYEEDGIFLSDSQFFATPLGNLPVDSISVQALADCGGSFSLNDIPHLGETSLEVLLPFVKYCFPEVSIVPVLMGGGQPNQVSDLAWGLGQVFGSELENTLILVSASLSLNSNESQALDQAKNCINYLMMRENQKFISGLYNGKISACGGPLIGALLQSGLMNGKTPKLISNSLLKARTERGKTTTYGAIAYE